MNIKTFRGFIFPVLTCAALAALFYFLLPVSPQSLLSADHVRWAYAATDFAPVVRSSLTSVWAALLWLMGSFGIGVDHQTFATSAALSSWIALAAFAVLSRYLEKWKFVVIALTPAVLWSAVVPNGTALSLLVLVLIGVWCSPEMTFERSRVRWTLGAVLEGLGCALTPFAWPLAIARAYCLRSASVAKSARLMRGVLFLVGFSLPTATAILLDAARGSTSSFAFLPVLSSLRMLTNDERIGAAAVFAATGEVFISYLASITFMSAAFLAPGWPSLTKRFLPPIGAAFVSAPLIIFLVAGYPTAWKLAHPGWNTVLEDFAQNIERSVSRPTIAIVPTLTEEAVLRYVDSLVSKNKNVIAFGRFGALSGERIEQIQSRESRFSLVEAEKNRTLADPPTETTEHKKEFADLVIAPNVARGVQFWVDTPPDRNEGLEIQFLASGMRVSAKAGATQFITDRNVLRESYIRARPTLKEFRAGRSIETDVFGRYALYHIAVARIIEREKRTADWNRRALGEYYAALKKVEWRKDLHQKVCVEPALEEAKNPRTDSSMATKAQPLDICDETAWFYDGANGKN